MATAGKPIECRAAVAWKAKEPIKIETITVAAPKDNEVRVKLVTAGICFSDLHMHHGGMETLEFPAVFGHECSAIVESVGNGVTSVKAGDSVIPLWTPNCGKCPLCLKGKRNLCLNIFMYVARGRMFDGTSRFSLNGKDIYAAMTVGGFSEYTVLPECSVAKLRPNIPLDKISAYGCCVPTGYGAAKYTAKVQPGESVAVIGLGAVGLCAVLGSRDCQAGRIIGVDINPDKEDIGKRFGLTDFVNPLDHPGKKTNEVIKEMTHGLGVDYVIICIGKNAVLEDCIEASSAGGGESIVIGLPEAKNISVDAIGLLSGRTLKGSWCGDCKCKKDIPDLIDKYMAGTMPTDELITSYITLEEINEGFQKLREGKSIRTIIKF